MTKIKIIKGVYGYKSKGSVVPKSKNDEPFEVSETEAKRLVELGVAEIASNLKSQADKPIKYSESLAPVKNIVDKYHKDKEASLTPENAEEISEDNTEDDTENNIVYSMDNTQKELLAMAKQLGFEGKDNTTKAELIAFLDEATSTEDAPSIADNEGVVD